MENKIKNRAIEKKYLSSGKNTTFVHNDKILNTLERALWVLHIITFVITIITVIGLLESDGSLKALEITTAILLMVVIFSEFVIDVIEKIIIRIYLHNIWGKNEFSGSAMTPKVHEKIIKKREIRFTGETIVKFQSNINIFNNNLSVVLDINNSRRFEFHVIRTIIDLKNKDIEIEISYYDEEDNIHTSTFDCNFQLKNGVWSGKLPTDWTYGELRWK